MNQGNESGLLNTNNSFKCCCSITQKHFEIDGKVTIQIISCILTVLTSLTATVANLLVIFSIWRTPSLHLPSNLLLVSLALSDLGVGMVANPLFLVSSIAKFKRQADLYCSNTSALMIASYSLCGVSLLTLTAISLDRYIALHLHLRYNEIVTVKRLCIIIVGIWLVCLGNGTSSVWNFTAVSYVCVIIIFVCFIVTAFAYCAICRVVRRHQASINAQLQVTEQEGSSLNMTEYKKSFVNMLLIYCVFLFCYTPFLAIRAVQLATTDESVAMHSASDIAGVLVHINSALNPFLYCWRFQQIRAAVKKTKEDLFQKIHPLHGVHGFYS